MSLWKSADGWAADFENKPAITTFKVVFWLVVLGFFVAVLLWVTGVTTAPWKGKGDAYIQKNSADNWVAAQKNFHQEVNDYNSDLVKIKAAKAALTQFEASPKPDANSITGYQWQQQDTNFHTTLTGLQQSCVQVTSSYSTDSQSYLTESFKDAGLPDSLDAAACTD